MTTYVATIDFYLSELDLELKRGDKVEFDGNLAKVGEVQKPAPNFRGAIFDRVVVPEEIFEDFVPQKPENVYVEKDVSKEFEVIGVTEIEKKLEMDRGARKYYLGINTQSNTETKKPATKFTGEIETYDEREAGSYKDGKFIKNEVQENPPLETVLGPIEIIGTTHKSVSVVNSQDLEGEVLPDLSSFIPESGLEISEEISSNKKTQLASEVDITQDGVKLPVVPPTSQVIASKRIGGPSSSYSDMGVGNPDGAKPLFAIPDGWGKMHWKSKESFINSTEDGMLLAQLAKMETGKFRETIQRRILAVGDK